MKISLLTLDCGVATHTQTCFSSGVFLFGSLITSCGIYHRVGLKALRRSSSASAWYACSMSSVVSYLLVTKREGVLTFGELYIVKAVFCPVPS